MSKYYRTCPDCGANLDPQERCDCQDTCCEVCGCSKTSERGWKGVWEFTSEDLTKRSGNYV